jgi:hypothetical protein
MRTWEQGTWEHKNMGTGEHKSMGSKPPGGSKSHLVAGVKDIAWEHWDKEHMNIRTWGCVIF